MSGKKIPLPSPLQLLASGLALAPLRHPEFRSCPQLPLARPMPASMPSPSRLALCCHRAGSPGSSEVGPSSLPLVPWAGGGDREPQDPLGTAGCLCRTPTSHRVELCAGPRQQPLG